MLFRFPLTLALLTLISLNVCGQPRFVKEVNNISELLHQNVQDKNQSVFVRGYFSPGDNGGGEFVLTNTIANTNSGTRIYSGTTNYSWERIIGDYISPKMFGAVGDGAANDFVAIQAAVNSPYGNVVFTPGIYRFNSPLVLTNSNLRLSSSGGDVVLNPDGLDIAISINSLTNIAIRNLKISGNSSKLIKIVGCNNIIITYCEFSDCQKPALDYTAPISIDNSSEIEISHTTFRNNGVNVDSYLTDYGIIFGVDSTTSSNNIVVENKYLGGFSKFAFVDFYGVNNKFLNNNIDQGNFGTINNTDGYGILGSFTTNMVVKGNIIFNCFGSGISLNNTIGSIISDNTVLNTVLQQSNSSIKPAGISLLNSGFSYISGNIVSNVVNPTSKGIDAINSVGINILNNYIYKAQDGIFLTGGNSNVISLNRIFNCDNNGIIETDTNLWILGNIISGCDIGIRTKGTNTRIEQDNDFRNNAVLINDSGGNVSQTISSGQSFSSKTTKFFILEHVSPTIITNITDGIPGFSRITLLGGNGNSRIQNNTFILLDGAADTILQAGDCLVLEYTFNNTWRQVSMGRNQDLFQIDNINNRVRLNQQVENYVLEILGKMLLFGSGVDTNRYIFDVIPTNIIANMLISRISGDTNTPGYLLQTDSSSNLFHSFYAGVRTPAYDLTSNVIDAHKGTFQRGIMSSNTTYTFLNFGVGDGVLVAITNSADYTPTFSGTTFQGGTSPTFATNDVIWVQFLCYYPNQLWGFTGSTTSGAGGGALTGSGVNNQVAIWNALHDLRGDANFTYDGTTFTINSPGTTDPVLVITNSTVGTDSVGIAQNRLDFNSTGNDAGVIQTTGANMWLWLKNLEGNAVLSLPFAAVALSSGSTNTTRTNGFAAISGSYGPPSANLNNNIEYSTYLGKAGAQGVYAPIDFDFLNSIFYIWNPYNTNWIAMNSSTNFGGFANPSSTIGSVANNGTLSTAMRSDAAQALTYPVEIGSTSNRLMRLNSNLIYTNATTGSIGFDLRNGNNDGASFYALGNLAIIKPLGTFTGSALQDSDARDFRFVGGNLYPGDAGISIGLPSNPANTVSNIHLGTGIIWNTPTNTVVDTFGYGTPEGSLAKSPSSLYRDLSNGKLYIKVTGTGNTGWEVFNSTSGGTGVNGTGAANQITYWSGSSTVTGNSEFLYDAANRVISIIPSGTTNISYRLLLGTGDTLIYSTIAADGTTFHGTNTIVSYPATFSYTIKNGSTQVADFTENLSVVVTDGTTTTSRTNKFIYLPSTAGAANGVPNSETSGTVPFAYDTSGNKIQYYNGSWKVMPMVSTADKGFIRLPISACTLPTSNPAQLDYNSTTGLRRLLFQTNTTCYFQITLPQDYGSSPTLRIPYSTSSATSGTASFQVSIWKQSPGDSADADTASYDTANTGTDTVPGTANFPDVVVVTLTNNDSMVAGDTVAIQITSNSNSSLNDLRIRGDFVLEYTKN